MIKYGWLIGTLFQIAEQSAFCSRLKISLKVQ